MIKHHEQSEQEQPISHEMVEKAVAHLGSLYGQYVAEEEPAAAEKIAMKIGRSIVEWEHKAGYNSDFMTHVVEHIERMFPDQEDEIADFFMHVRRVFFDLLGYFVSSQRHELVHELMNDKVLDALDEEGFFDMMAMEHALDYDEEDEDEDQDGCDEDGCCSQDDEDECSCDENECSCHGCACEDEDCCCDEDEDDEDEEDDFI